MSYTSFISILIFLFVFILPAHATEQTDAEVYSITPMSEEIQVQTKCGQYFGYNTYPGVAERCISFSYESGESVFIRTVAISTLKPEIDSSVEQPTVSFASTDEVIIKISQQDYDAEKECLPELEKKEQ